jgi:hypothetical protein
VITVIFRGRSGYAEAGLAPPLVITEAQIDLFVKNLPDVLDIAAASSSHRWTGRLESRGPRSSSR